ncbi:hypothetical protein HY639_03360 [Candidatus Woesearchaeota archaeon]|nr:hypothetical protein [Candidatus Woesearchaeota archaeon]
MKDIPKEVVFVLFAIYAVLLVIQGYVLLDFATTGRATTGSGSVSVCIDNPAAFSLPLGCPVNVTAGKVYFCDINATDPDGGNVTFADNTDLFTIGPSTGIVVFSPGLSAVGSHAVVITATDEGGCGSTPVTAGLNFDVLIPVCGNGELELGEDCDNGNTTLYWCSDTCTLRAASEDVTGGGGGGGGGAGPQQQAAAAAALGIGMASSQSLAAGKSITAPVYVRNTKNVAMHEVIVEVTSNPLSVTVEPRFFEKLDPGESLKATLTIDAATAEPGEHKVHVLVFSKDPPFQVKQTMYVTVTPREESREGQATPQVPVTQPVSKLEQGYAILRQHPECVIVTEIIQQAQSAVADGQFDRGEALAQSAIDICSFLAGAGAKEVHEKVPIGAVTEALGTKRDLTSNIIVSAIIIGLLFFLLSYYFWSSYKRQFVQPKASAALTRVQALIRDVYAALEKEDIVDAKKTYTSLQRLYATLKKQEQAVVYKDILVLYKQIEETVKR